MSPFRGLGWMASGLAACVAAWTALGPAGAEAQTRPAYAGTPGRATTAAVVRHDQSTEADSNESLAASGMRGALPWRDPAADPAHDEDDPDPRPRAGQRTIVRDGDPQTDSDLRIPRDGIIDLGEPESPHDGVDPLTVDSRPPEDIAAFENPPAGHDPLLFQIEEAEPLEDRRTRRLFAIEPYDPVGVPIGSFVLFPEIELGASAFSNVFSSPAGKSDTSLEARPSARLVSNWSNHALEFRAAGTFSHFDAFDSENENGYLLEARGRLDITRRTNIQALVGRERSQESRSAIDAASIGDRADLTTSRAAIALSHRFNRLSLQLRGAIAEQSVGDVTANGILFRNDDRNHTRTEEAVRASWELKPTLFVFSEVELNQRTFERAAQSDGIRRDSSGERYRVGLAFGNTGKTLRGEISIGYGTQRPDDPRLADVSGVLLDSNLAWRLSELTSLLFTARSDVSETTTAFSPGVLTHQVGIEARHAFLRHLIGSAGISYTTQDFARVAIDEKEWRSALGLEYFLNREAVLFGTYARTAFSSSQPHADYTSDELRVGVRLRR